MAISQYQGTEMSVVSSAPVWQKCIAWLATVTKEVDQCIKKDITNRKYANLIVANGLLYYLRGLSSLCIQNEAIFNFPNVFSFKQVAASYINANFIPYISE